MAQGIEEQLSIRTAPTTNDEGVRVARDQMHMLLEKGKGWTAWYERDSDTMYLRRGYGAQPSMTYFLPDEPEILVSLDMFSSQLIGIDLTDFRLVLAKRHPELAGMVPTRWHSLWNHLRVLPDLIKQPKKASLPESLTKQIGHVLCGTH